MAKDKDGKDEKRAPNKWLKELRKADDIVDFDYDAYAPKNCYPAPTPYFGWILGNKSGMIPKKGTILFFSQPKAGKSLLSAAIVSEILEQDENKESVAIYINSELRGSLQKGMLKESIIDRVLMKDSNDPLAIFDWLESEIRAQVEEPDEERRMPLRVIVIDSLSNITGVKRQDAESIGQHLMGDQAITLQLGLQRLIPFCRKNGILLIATAQMRANFDGGAYGPKFKMQSSLGVKHSFDYFISLARAGGADEKVNVLGETYEDQDIKDARGNKILNGHKIFIKNEESSVGPSGRAGIVTISYDEGVTDKWEEIFLLGKAMGVLATTNNRTYEFDGQKFNGKKEAAIAIRDNPELAKAIMTAVIALDSKK